MRSPQPSAGIPLQRAGATWSWRHAALALAIASTASTLSLVIERDHRHIDLVSTEHPDAPGPLVTALDGGLPDGAPATSKAVTSADAEIHNEAIALAVVAEPPSERISAVETVAVTPTAISVSPVTMPPLPEPARPAEVTASATMPAAPPAPVEQPSAPSPGAVEPPPPASTTQVRSRYATIAELEAALAQTPWPAELWPQIIRIAQCESGGDPDRDGYKDVVDTQARGAGGLYVGVMQIDRNHRFSVAYDLETLEGNLLAAYELWVRAGHSFAPWGCKGQA